MSAAAAAVYLLVRTSLLLALFWAAAAAVRKAGGSAAMRHMIWLFGLGALIVFPLLSAVVPPLRVPILPPDVVASPPPQGAARIVTAPPVHAAASAALGLGGLGEIVYLAIAAGLLGRLALGNSLLGRLWKRTRPADDAQWTELLASLAGALGIRRSVALRIAGTPAMPMTWGTLRPRVLLPAEALTWTDERRRIVLLHELAHVARRDSLGRMIAGIVCALYWPHPAVWYAARRMRLEQEHACDDLVLALGARARDYARNLLDVAGTFRLPRTIGILSVAMARTSELEHRLIAIVGRGPRGRSSFGFVTGSGSAALLATMLVATVAPVAAFAPIARLPNRADGKSAGADAAPIAAVPLPRAIEPPVRPRTLLASFVSTRTQAAPALPANATVESYDQMVERHRRDLGEYNRRLTQYNQELVANSRQFNRDLSAYNRRLRELQGNIGNTGNSGNSGNSGNFGNPGLPARPGQPAIPPTPPTAPTMPTMPTPPTPLHPPAAVTPPSQGP